MEGNLDILPTWGSSDLCIQGSIRSDDYLHQDSKQPANHLNQHCQSYPHFPVQTLISCTSDVLPPRPTRPKKDCVQFISFMDLAKEKEDERFSITYDDGSSVVSYEAYGNNDTSKGSKCSSDWHRVKWSNEMVRLLITAVSYVSGDVATKKNAMLQKKGKWRYVSEAMTEKGFYISPQQCEDKFNDLNKRYKRLNGILGEGTASKIVEKPQLLDMLDHLSERTKEEVNKILSSKQLFYREMCFYHNGNTMHRLRHPTSRHSPEFAINNCDLIMQSHDDDRDNDNDHHEKNTNKGQDHDMEKLFSWGNSWNSNISNKSKEGRGLQTNDNGNISKVFREGTTGAWFYNQWMKSRLLELEEKIVEIQMEILEIQEQCLNCQELRKRKNRTLDKLRMRNQRIKFENKFMELELKQKESLSLESGVFGYQTNTI